MQRKGWLAIGLLIVLIIVTACAQNDSNTPETSNTGEANNESSTGNNDLNENGNNETGGDPEPVTLTWAHQWGEDHFNDHFATYIEEEFPHIRLEFVEAGTDHPETLEDLVLAGQIPDIVTATWASHIPFLDDLGLAYDLDELVAENNFDLSRINDAMIQYIRNYAVDQNDGLYVLPVQRELFALHYDKDIFDMFAISYPEDGMTWSEVVDLASDLTREEDGVQYRGLDLDDVYPAWTQFSANTADPETNEVIIENNDAVRQFLQMVGDAVTIPGNFDFEPRGEGLLNWGAHFLEEQNVAMSPRGLWEEILTEEGRNIGIVSYPVWEGYEGIDPIARGMSIAITEPSEHKQEAFEVIAYMLSDEIQRDLSEKGWATSLDDTSIQEAFASANEEYADIDFSSVFINEPAAGPDSYPEYGTGVMWTAPQEYANVVDETDLNEFMRELQEIGEENVRESMMQD